MKKPLLVYCCLLLFFLTPFSCKKYVQQQEQNALVELVTNGTWRVTGYYDHQTINLTDSFTGYSFQFNQNGTVVGTRAGVEMTGSWSADIPTKMIYSSFPTTTIPLSLLNYSWKITDSSPTTVLAKTPVDSSFNILNLLKNP
jgi:hypothetical protein